MTTKKPAPKRIRKPAAQQTGNVTIVELDAKVVTDALSGMTTLIERNNQLLGSFHQPSPQDTVSGSSPMSILGQNHAAGKPPAPLPSLDSIAHSLASKVRAVYGFSCHLREQVEEVPPLEQEFSLPEPGLKGLLDAALKMLEIAHDNLIMTRNVISAVLIVLVLTGASALAQAKPNIACDDTPTPTTGFTGCEILRLRDYLSQEQMLRAQLEPLDKEASDFIQKVVANNPGKTYERPSQQFPLGRLIAVAPPAKK